MNPVFSGNGWLKPLWAVVNGQPVYNRVKDLNIFLRANGMPRLLAPNDWPRYTEKVVSAYGEDELKRLFDAADGNDRLAFRFSPQNRNHAWDVHGRAVNSGGQGRDL